MRIAPEGWPIILAVVAVCAGAVGLAAWLGGALALSGAGVLAGLFVFWALWFFRDPLRRPPAAPAGRDMIISPADGRVIKIDWVELPPQIRDGAAPATQSAKRQRVAIFLNLFNVHVNRTPAAGRIVKLAYVPGKFVNASFDKASEHNERSLALMVDDAGREIGFVQIAGLVARRIINHLREGQQVTLGERFGLIRFGSRAEVYLPEGSELCVNVGDHVVAGESMLATMKANAARHASGPGVSTPEARSIAGAAAGVRA